MTREDIIRMASEAGMETHERKQQVRIGSAVLVGGDSTDEVVRFARLIAEDCAKRCEAVRAHHEAERSTAWSELTRGVEFGAEECAAAIREAYKP